MNDEQYAKIIGKISSIETSVEDTHHRLFGNGQPGELEVLRKQQKETDATLNRGRGILMACGGLTTFVGGVELLKSLGMIK